jgi:predicted Zn-dependent protease
LKAYALLIAEHREKDADALLYDAYNKLVRSRYADDASLAGLAEIEARRGRSEEDSRLLKLLVERSTDNLKALQLAAETAARSTRYSDAIDFREQIARSRPDDAVNKLELARVVAAAGRAGDAVDQLVTLITDKATANSVRAQAAEVVAEIVSRDRSLASRATALLDQRERGAAASIARAAISEAAGNREEARTALASVTSGPLAAVAQMKLGQLTLAMGRDAEAVASFERAIYLDADGIITDAIAFRTPGPRAQLIKLYGKIGRDLAAVRLADAEPQNAQSSLSAAITAAIRRAVSPGFAREGAQATVLFEPSLEITRSRTTGLTTLAEMKDSTASSVRDELLASLVESAAKLGQYDRAMAIERLRAAEATKAEEKAAIEKRLAEIAAAERARQLRLALMTRINRSNATESVYATRVLGKE